MTKIKGRKNLSNTQCVTEKKLALTDCYIFHVKKKQMKNLHFKK